MLIPSNHKRVLETDRKVKKKRRVGTEGNVTTGLGLAESKDESLRALNYILEAWEDGIGSGLAPEALAYAALFTALTDLVAAYGEDNVLQLIAGLGPRVQAGEFTLCRTKQ